MIEFLKAQFNANPLRYINYGATAAVWIVVKGSELLGSPIAPNSDVALAVGTLVTAALTELARRFVWAPASVAAIQPRAGDNI